MQSDKNMTHLSQNLRKGSTPEENTLWYQYLRTHPLRWRRQCAFGRYIVGFYCAKEQLVVELDGSQHYENGAQKHDAQRTAYLNELGIEVLRFANTDIKQNLAGVCQTIDQRIDKRMSEEFSGPGRQAYTTKKPYQIL